MTDLDDFARLVSRDHGLCVVSTLAPTGVIQSSVVNAGVLAHPVSKAAVVGFVARGGARKMYRARRSRRTASFTGRSQIPGVRLLPCVESS